MEIRQEVSDVGSPSFGDTNSPSFTSRETETRVVVQNRESVLIGGIIDERIERIRNGVPFLMDVPVLAGQRASGYGSVCRGGAVVPASARD